MSSLLDNPIIRQIVAEEVAAFEAMLADIVDLIPQKAHGRQKLFLEDLSSVREAMYGGAAGGGKSSAILLAGLRYIDVPHYAGLILRRTFKDLALPDAIMSRAKEWLIGKPGVHWDGDNYTFRFDCKGGGHSTLTFGYLETEVDKYRYQSSAFQFIAPDELTQFMESQYLYMFSRLRRPAIPCRHCLVPLRRVDGAWIHAQDSECQTPEGEMNSLKEYAQLYDVPLRMRSATNPGGVGHEWVKDRFIPEDYSGPDEARVWEKEGVTAEGKPFHTYFVPSRLQDNPFLDQAEYEESLGLLDYVTSRQLLHGDWAISPTGDCYFDFKGLAKTCQPIEPAIGELELETNSLGETELYFRPQPNGKLAIWRKPQRGRRYAIGCDTATGKDANKGESDKADRDWSVCNVRDVDSGEQVARYRGKVKEPWFGEMWYRLSRWYNGAYLVPAMTGGYGRAALLRAFDLGLSPALVYCQEDETGAPGQRKSGDPDYGFYESSSTRNPLYANLLIAMLDGGIQTYDAVTINEYYSFEVNKNGKPEARAGCKDDCVTADALAVKGIQVAPRYLAVLAQQNAATPQLPKHYGRNGALTEVQKAVMIAEARRRNSRGG